MVLRVPYCVLRSRGTELHSGYAIRNTQEEPNFSRMRREGGESNGRAYVRLQASINKHVAGAATVGAPRPAGQGGGAVLGGLTPGERFARGGL